MTAESDIAAIADGASNPASRVRTALTAVLGRADKATDQNVRTAGDVTITSTSNQVIDAGLDLTVAAVTGDVLMAGISARWDVENASAYLDFYTWDGSAPVNPFGPGLDRTGSPLLNGLAYAHSGQTNAVFVGGSTLYTVVAGDIVAGNVTLRLYGASSGSNKSILASQTNPLTVWVVNLGL